MSQEVEEHVPASESPPPEIEAGDVPAVSAEAESPPTDETESASKSGGLRSLGGALGKTSAYTWMLGLSLVAIIVAVACLAAELSRYNYDITATRGRAMVPPTAGDGN